MYKRQDDETITIGEGSDLELMLPESSFSGTVLWTAPNGETFDSNTASVMNVVDNGPYEGDWSLEVAFSPNCGTTPQQTINFSINIESTLSTNENELENLRIYPNPTSDQITISSSSNLDNLKISLVDISGRKLKDNFDPVRISSNQLSMDMSKLATGMYFIILKDDEFKSIKAVVKN